MSPALASHCVLPRKMITEMQRTSAESVIAETMMRPLTRRVVVLPRKVHDGVSNSSVNNILPDDLIYACLQFCDLKSLWAYGLTSRIAAKRVFESTMGADIVNSLSHAFEGRLRQRLSNCARIRIQSAQHLQYQSNGFWGSASGHVVSKCAAHTFAEYLDVYPSFPSFLQQKVWSATRLQKPWCDPILYQDTIIYASSPTMLHKVTLKKQGFVIDSSHRLIGNTKIWTIALIASPSRPSILVLTSDGILHFPSVFCSDKEEHVFGSRLIYTADWVKKALPPAIVQWDKGGTLLAMRSVAAEHSHQVHIIRLHDISGQMEDFGTVQFPCCNKLALHKSGVLAVASSLGIQKPVQLWKIQEDKNHVQLPLSHPESFVLDNLIFLQFIGSTLLGITERGMATGWDLNNNSGGPRMIGRSKLCRRTDNGPFYRVILWPRRGSIFVISGDRKSVV